MSRFAFEIPTEQEAREFLEWRRRTNNYQAELYADTIACQRRLRDVKTDRPCVCESPEHCEKCHQPHAHCRCGKPKHSKPRI